MAQLASLTEVINLVDYITRQQTPLSMEEIETTYVNLLGGKDALEQHVPSFSREWLKVLPNLRSVLQKQMQISYSVFGRNVRKIRSMILQMTRPWTIWMSNIRQHHWFAKALTISQTEISRINRYKFLAVIRMFLESLRQ